MTTWDLKDVEIGAKQAPTTQSWALSDVDIAKYQDPNDPYVQIEKRYQDSKGFLRKGERDTSLNWKEATNAAAAQAAADLEKDPEFAKLDPAQKQAKFNEFVRSKSSAVAYNDETPGGIDFRRSRVTSALASAGGGFMGAVQAIRAPIDVAAAKAMGENPKTVMSIGNNQGPAVVNPDTNSTNIVGRVVGGAVPIIAGGALGGAVGGAVVGGAQGAGSGVEEGVMNDYTAGQTATLAGTRGLFNAIIGAIPGGSASGNVVKDVAKAGVSIWGTNVGLAAAEAKVKQAIGIESDDAWEAMKKAAASGETWAQVIIFGGVHGVVSAMKPETPQPEGVKTETIVRSPQRQLSTPDEPPVESMPGRPATPYREPGPQDIYDAVNLKYGVKGRTVDANGRVIDQPRLDGGDELGGGVPNQPPKPRPQLPGSSQGKLPEGSQPQLPSQAQPSQPTGNVFSENYYERLGISPDASPEEITSAWRARSKQLHPDVGGSHETASMLNEAQRVLSNPVLREEFDKGGQVGVAKFEREMRVKAQEAVRAKANTKTVRLYRGETNSPNEQPGPSLDWIRTHPEYQDLVDATGRWFYSTEKEARDFSRDFGNGSVTYVDIPENQLESYRVINQPDRRKFSAQGRHNEEFFVPKEVAKTRQKLNYDEGKLPTPEQPAHVTRMTELASELVKSQTRTEEIRNQQREGVMKGGEAHDELGRINADNIARYNELNDILTKATGKPATIFDVIQKVQELAPDFSGKRKSTQPGQRSGGFVDFSPIIDSAIDSGKWLAHHTAAAADWVLRKVGSLTGIREALVTRFGERIKGKLPAIVSLAKQMFREGRIWRSMETTFEKMTTTKFSQEVSSRMNRVTDEMKKGFGNDMPLFDRAVKTMSSLFGKGALSKNDVHDIEGTDTFVANSRVGLEPSNYPEFKNPSEMKDVTNLLAAANRIGGKHAEGVIEDFKASGKMQRLPTFQLVDAIKKGSGKVYDSYVQSVFKLNPGLDQAKFLGVLSEIRDHLINDRYDAAYRLISQEHTRVIPRVPSGMWVHGQPTWFFHDAPADYLKTMKDRVLGRVAFLKEFGGENMTELKQKLNSERTGSGQALVDLQRVVHGLPVDANSLDPTSALSQVNRAFQAGNRISNAALTLGAIPANLLETLTGNHVVVFGGKWATEGAKYLKKHGMQGLENLGAIDRAFTDLSVDPNSVLRTGLRITRGSLAVGNKMANELAEIGSAAIARVMTNLAKEKKLSSEDQNKLQYATRLFGFSKEQARQVANGSAKQELYDAVVRKAASTLVGGNIRAAERSRLENSKIFQQWFPFLSYPAMQLRLMDKTLVEAMSAWKDRKANPEYAKTAVSGFGRVWGAVPVRGVMIHLVGALLTGGVAGLKIAVNEDAEKALHDPIQFLAGLFAKGIGGPLSMIKQFFGSKKNFFDPAKYSVSAGFAEDSAMAVRDLLSSISLRNDYKGMGAWDAAVTFAQKRLPASRIATTWWSIYGLGQNNVELDEAQKAFNRWKRDEEIEDFSTSSSPTEFRMVMKKAAEIIEQHGDPTDWLKKNLPEFTSGQPVASSLNGRRMLAGLPKDLEPEKLASLKRRLGPDGYKVLQQYDDLLSAWADQYQVVESVATVKGSAEGKKHLTSPKEGQLDKLTQYEKRVRELKESK